MKIKVVSRHFVEKQMNSNPNWIQNKWIISIYSNNSISPLPNRFNILKLQFDDVSERDLDSWNSAIDNTIFFNEDQAKQIHEFISSIPANSEKIFYVHCDAGVSRSGAVGYILNEWFNKFITTNKEDQSFFQINNSHIMPNPLVVRLLKFVLFGTDYSGVFVNDYEYDENGNKIDHIEEI
jgi:predicted protein tyrosine phosphatase